MQVGVGRAVGDFDRLGAHQPVAENLGFRIGRNAVFALDGEPQHDFVAAGQEAASQFVGHLLQGVEVAGRRILDLCAS